MYYVTNEPISNFPFIRFASIRFTRTKFLPEERKEEKHIEKSQQERPILPCTSKIIIPVMISVEIMTKKIRENWKTEPTSDSINW